METQAPETQAPGGQTSAGQTSAGQAGPGVLIAADGTRHDCVCKAPRFVRGPRAKRTEETSRLLAGLRVEANAAARAFHATLPGYAPSPLVSLPGLARALGLASVRVKDESTRFGLHAFKALGSSWAMAVVLARRAGLSDASLRDGSLTFERVRALGGGEEPLLFVTATDGNHGRGVAWAARVLGHRARVLMPKGTAQARLENVLAQGADAEITDLVYDDCVRLAARVAEESGGVLVQDTSWPGYGDIPYLILQGYTTIVSETAEVLAAEGGEPPTHVFLQAGVGGFAAALAAAFSDLFPQTRFVVLEPSSADCLFRSAAAGDGLPHAVDGEMTSMMAGLCCGEPSPQAWEILRALPCDHLALGDDVSALGMRLLARPLPGDPAVESGESGAVGAGALAALCADPALKDLRAALDLGPASRVLLVSTEGCTDPVNYERVVGFAPARLS